MRAHEEVGARREEGREGGREEECTKRDLGMEGGGMRERERERERDEDTHLSSCPFHLATHFLYSVFLSTGCRRLFSPAGLSGMRLWVHEEVGEREVREGGRKGGEGERRDGREARREGGHERKWEERGTEK